MTPIIVILLIDFEGHPLLSNDEVLNNLRFSHLKNFIFNPISDNNQRGYRFLFISNHDEHHEKMIELQKMSEAEGYHEWINIKPEQEYTPHYLNEMIGDKGYSIQNIIAGGCNTAGCMLNTKSYSPVRWAKAGYPMQIFLPMCADYQLQGATTFESQMNGISNLYRGLIEKDAIFDVDVIMNEWQIKGLN